ncbi:MAG TPA: LuxR C-terminal-related transcriptional regulator, partial [Acidimicrobiales bacterium]|nr:LuxR C-terminal-related transcriptional regulator [Acidimicrobiales bacterium]
AGILEAQGDVTAAVELLDEAERFYDTDFSPDVRPVGAVRARVQAAHGQIDEALGWVRQRRLTPEDDLGYLNEFEHITLARVLLGQHRTGRSGRSLQDASGLLGRLLAGAETGKRTGAVIEILVLQSLVSQARGEASAALASLRRAVELGEPEGYVRVFAGEGPPLAHLLQALAKHGILADYIHRLLAATAAAGSRPVKQPLVDPLSDRELAVLRLLASDLGGPDIARELMVSLNTMRTHTKSIYAKLGVNDRRTAVRKAQELRLLNPQH